MAGERRFFSGYSFRTSSRFGSYVELSVGEGLLVVTGRRVPRWMRDAWIGAQAGLLSAFLAKVLLGRRGRLRTFFFDWLVASFGALLLWWPSERGPRGLMHGVSPEFRATGTETAARSYRSYAFRLADVSGVRVGRPWYWRRGLWYVAWPWQLALLPFGGGDKLVVFDVSVDEAPRKKAVFALQMDSAEEARALAEALRSEA